MLSARRALWCAITLIPAIALTGTRTNVVMLCDEIVHAKGSLIYYDGAGVQTIVRARPLPRKGKVFRLHLAPNTYTIFGTVERAPEAWGTSLLWEERE